MNVHPPNARLILGITVAFALLLVAVAAVYAAAPPNVDTFTDSIAASLLVPDGATASASTTSATTDDDILGNVRDIYVYNVSAPDQQTVSVNVTEGVFSHSQNSGTTANSVLTYDGPGGGYPSTIYNGLCAPTCIDLTEGGLRNGFRFSLAFDDLPVDVRIKVYDGSDANSYSEVTITDLFPGGITTPDEIVVEFPTILAGSQGPNGPADFGNVGAIEFEFEGDIQATDLTIDAIDVAVLDWGDLPETNDCTSSAYATTNDCEGPRHAVQGDLFLGSTVDPSAVLSGEFDGQPSVGANGDDFANTDDEDGVTPVVAPNTGGNPLWGNGPEGGAVDIQVNGSGHLVGWVDFDGDGFGPGDVIVNQPVGSGTQTYVFDIPDGTLPPTGSVTLYARFRLFPVGAVLQELTAPYAFDGRDQFGQFTGLNLPAPGQVSNGEVEDYAWTFNFGTAPCPLTPGYWKTHSEYGPAPYDPTWALLPDGADTPFYLSDQSYYEVLWTPPAGNKYYILAHHFIAAQLNFLNGAEVPDNVAAAWSAGQDLLQTYAPSEVPSLPKAIQKQFTEIGKVLDRYNNGWYTNSCEG